MRPVWAKAVDELKRATRICIVGYSMPESDSFFKYLLTLGLAENHQLYKMIVVDKLDRGYNVDGFDLGGGQGESEVRNQETIKERYRRMLSRLFSKKRFEFFGNGFEQFLRQEANMALRRAETLSMR